MTRITIIGVNYYQEDSAIGLYTTQKAEYLANHGYDVSVITGFPYYPKWEIQEEYKTKNRYFFETINGISVYRYKQYVPKKPTFFKRIVHLVSFTTGSIINLFKIKKPDIVISIVPFTTSILLGWLLKLRYKSKLWIHIQDFEFDAAIDSGLLDKKKSVFVSILLWIEKRLLNRANHISTISYGMLNKLKEKVGKEGYYLTNWLDTSVFVNEENITIHPYIQEDKFTILYSGNIGAKQDWDFFFEFLNALKTKENIEVILVGEGAAEEEVKEKCDQYSFVKQYSLVPFKELPQLLKSADVHILFQKDDVIDTVMPSKILGMMGSAVPSIITGNEKSEVKQILEDSKGGFYFQNTQLSTIISTIEKLQNNADMSMTLGANAKQYILELYSKEAVLGEFIKTLKTL